MGSDWEPEYIIINETPGKLGQKSMRNLQNGRHTITGAWVCRADQERSERATKYPPHHQQNLKWTKDMTGELSWWDACHPRQSVRVGA